MFHIIIHDDLLPQGVTSEDIAPAIEVRQLSPHPRLKLFVWEHALCDYSCGLAVALAHDSEEARKMIVNKLGYEHADLSRAPQIFDATGDPVAFYAYGGG